MLIGKKLTILITEDMIVDASFIAKVKKGEIEYKGVFFDMIRTEECDNLINYMANNQLVIESGIYIIHQAWSSDKVIENLRFKKQNTDAGCSCAYRKCNP